MAGCGVLAAVTEVRILPPQLKNRSDTRLLPVVVQVRILAAAFDASPAVRPEVYAAACVAQSRYSS